MRHALLALVSGVLACSPVAPSTDAGAGGGAGGGGGGPAPAPVIDDGGFAASGSRLKSRWHIADGGARQWLSFVDIERNLPCEPFEAGGGRIVCGPLGANLGLAQGFSDSMCRTPATAFGPPACTGGDAPYLLEYEPSASQCVAPAARLWLAAPVTTSMSWSSSDAGVCAADALPMPTRLLTATTPLPLTTLVDFSTAEARRGALTARFLVSPDGARVLSELRLTSSGVSVDALPHPDGGGRFLPRVATYADSSQQDYADSSCTTPAAYGIKTACPLPEAETPLLRLFTVSACGVAVAVHERGALLTDDGGVWSRIQGGPCMPDSPNKRLYALGARVNDDTFPPLRTAPLGQGRLRFHAVVDAAGNLSQRQGSWRDEALGLPCQPERASDDTLRCLPLELDGRVLDVEPTWFGDASCSRPLFQELTLTCGQTAPRYVLTRARLASGLPDPCRGPTVYGIGARFQGASAWTKDAVSGACSMAPAPAVTLFETSLVPPTSFEALSLVVE